MSVIVKLSLLIVLLAGCSGDNAPAKPALPLPSAALNVALDPDQARYPWDEPGITAAFEAQSAAGVSRVYVFSRFFFWELRREAGQISYVGKGDLRDWDIHTPFGAASNLLANDDSGYFRKHGITAAVHWNDSYYAFAGPYYWEISEKAGYRVMDHGLLSEHPLWRDHAPAVNGKKPFDDDGPLGVAVRDAQQRLVFFTEDAYWVFDAQAEAHRAWRAGPLNSVPGFNAALEAAKAKANSARPFKLTAAYGTQDEIVWFSATTQWTTRYSFPTMALTLQQPFVIEDLWKADAKENFLSLPVEHAWEPPATIRGSLRHILWGKQTPQGTNVPVPHTKLVLGYIIAGRVGAYDSAAVQQVVTDAQGAFVFQHVHPHRSGVLFLDYVVKQELLTKPSPGNEPAQTLVFTTKPGQTLNLNQLAYRRFSPKSLGDYATQYSAKSGTLMIYASNEEYVANQVTLSIVAKGDDTFGFELAASGTAESGVETSLHFTFATELQAESDGTLKAKCTQNGQPASLVVGSAGTGGINIERNYDAYCNTVTGNFRSTILPNGTLAIVAESSRMDEARWIRARLSE